MDYNINWSLQNMNNLVEAFECIQSNNNEQRKQAEAYIHSLSDDPQFLATLMQIMECSDQSLKISISSYLLLYAKQLDPSNIPSLTATIVTLLNSLQSQNIGTKVKTILKGIITSIVSKDKHSILYKLIINNLEVKIQEKKGNMNLWDYQYFGNYIHICLLKKDQTSSKVMNKLYDQLLGFISALLDQIQLGEGKQTPQNMHQLSALKSLLYPLAFMFDFTKFFVANKENMNLFSNQSLNSILFKCFNNIKSKGNKSISLNSDPFDQDVLVIKGTISRVFLNSIKIMLMGLHEPYLSMNTVFKNKEYYLNELVQSVVDLLKQKDYHLDELYRGTSFEEIINTVVELGNVPEFTHYYSLNKQLLIEGVIFPILNLRTNIQLSYAQPQQMFNSTVYLVNQGIVAENQASEQFMEGIQMSIQVRATKLIHYLCRHIDGITTQLVNDCLISIEVNPQNTIALLILNSLVQKVNGRDDLIDKIKQYAVRQVGKYDEKRSPSETYYLKLLLGYRYLELFGKDFMNEFWGLATHILNNGKDQTLKYLCLEVFVVTIKLGFTTLYEQRSKTINTLTSLIMLYRTQGDLSHTVLMRVFDCLEQVLTQTPEVSMMQSHIESCISEITRQLTLIYESPQKNNNLIINKCWNIIKTVVDKSNCSRSLLNSIEDLVIPLYKHILEPEVDEQQFIYCLGVFIRSAQKVSKQYQISFFSSLPVFFQKNKYRFFDLFETLNIYIQYGPNMFIDNSPNIQMIIAMLVKVLELEDAKEDECCEGVLVMQNLIYNYHQHFKEQYWAVVLETVLKKLNQYVKNSFFTSNLIVILGLSFLSNFEALHNTQVGQAILTQMMRISCFIQPYPAKVHIVCLCDLLSKTESHIVQNHYTQILDSSITLTRSSHYRNEVQLDEDEQQNFNDINDEYRGYHMVVERFSSKLKQLDEFEIMKKALKDLKTKHPDILSGVIKELPAQKVEFMKLVMQIEKVGQKEYRSIVRVKRQE